MFDSVLSVKGFTSFPPTDLLACSNSEITSETRPCHAGIRTGRHGVSALNDRASSVIHWPQVHWQRV